MGEEVGGVSSLHFFFAKVSINKIVMVVESATYMRSFSTVVVSNTGTRFDTPVNEYEIRPTANERLRLRIFFAQHPAHEAPYHMIPAGTYQAPDTWCARMASMPPIYSTEVQLLWFQT